MVSIPGIIRSIREKKQKEQAFSGGSEVASRGNVLVPTTRGFVEVPKDSDIGRSSGGFRGGSSGGSSSGGSSGVGEGSSTQTETNRLAEFKQQQEKQTRQALADLSRQYNQDLRNIEGVSGRTDRLKKYQEDRERITQGRKDIVSGGTRTTSSVTRDTKTGEIKRTEETIRGRAGEKIVIKKDYTSGTERIDTFGVGGGRTGSSYAKQVLVEVPEKEKDNAKNIVLPSYESKFSQPTRSTRTDLRYEDVRPRGLDMSKVNQFLEDTTQKITNVSIGGTSVGQVLDKPIVSIPDTTIYQKSTLMDSGKTNIMIAGTDFTIGNLLSTPVEISRGLGSTAEKGVSIFASQIERIPGDIKSVGGTTIKGNIVGSLNLIGKPVAKVLPELALFGVAPISTSVSGFAYERQEGNLGKAGQYAILGGLFTALKVVPNLKIPKGKRAQASLEQISKNRFDKLREALAKLEKDIASKKAGKEQLKFIAEKRASLTTNLEKANFDKYIQSLIEKDIVKIPKIEITEQGITTPPTINGEIEIIGLPQSKGAGGITGSSIQESPYNVIDLKNDNKQFNLLNVKQDIKSDIQTKQKTIQQIKILTAQKIKTKQKTAIKTMLDIKSDIQTKQQNKMKNMVRSLLGTLQKSKLETKISQRLVRDSLGKPRPQKEPGKIIKPITFDKEKPKIVKEAEKVLGSFEAFGRRFGKDISLGMFETKIGAIKKLKEFAEFSLGASGFVSSGGRKVKINNLGERFTTSKKDPFRIVEKKQYRLSTGSEKSEINFFKKKAKKKSNSWF